MVEIRLDPSYIETAATVLKSLGGDALTRAEYNAFNRGITYYRHHAAGEAAKTYDIGRNDIKENFASGWRRGGGELTAYLRSIGNVYAITDFPHTRSRPPAANVLRGSPLAEFSDAFYASLRYGPGFFTRDSDGLHGTYSPSFEQMLAKDEVADRLGEETGRVVEARLMHEVERILNGW